MPACGQAERVAALEKANRELGWQVAMLARPGGGNADEGGGSGSGGGSRARRAYTGNGTRGPALPGAPDEAPPGSAPGARCSPVHGRNDVLSGCLLISIFCAGFAACALIGLCCASRASCWQWLHDHVKSSSEYQ